MTWILREGERQKIAITTGISSLGSATADGGEIIGSVRWYDLKSGTVEWIFENRSSILKHIVLLRNGYMFGDAFWPVYVANSNGRGASTNPSDNFGVNWIDSASSNIPLKNLGTAKNTMPIGLVTTTSSTVSINNGNTTVAFIFTLGGGSKYSVLEGGFSESMPPVIQQIFPVSQLYCGKACIGYDTQRVLDWDTQTGTSLQGYSPNPASVDTCLFMLPAGSPFDTLKYRDKFKLGIC